MRAPQIAAYALIANGLIGLAIELKKDISDQTAAVAFVALLALDLVAFACLATLRRRLPSWAQIGLLGWGVALLVTAYWTTWIVWYLTGGHPTFEVGENVYVLEQLARAAGQGCLVIALALTARRHAISIAAAVWGGLALVALVLYVHLYIGDVEEVSESLRILREVSYSGSMVLLAGITLAAVRVLDAQEPPAARVVR